MPTVAITLGRLGLVPFCAAPVLMYLDPHHRALYGEWLSSYALAILCFLVGIWWGLALIRRGAWALVASYLIVVLAFVGQLLLPGYGFFLLCALLFPATVLVERRASLFKPQPAYYARLRLQLTMVATLALLIAAGLS